MCLEGESATGPGCVHAKLPFVFDSMLSLLVSVLF